jgi:hypothetical protein
LIGGLGVGATIYYYQELVKAHLERGQVALVFNRANTDFPHVDGARLHLEAIMEQLTGNPSH